MNDAAEIDEVLLLKQVIAQLQAKCDAQNARIHEYYREEITARGDKIMMREYKQFFQITP